jgi:hypothetical protein
MKSFRKLLLIVSFIAHIINSNAQTASWVYGTNVARLNPTTANLGIGTTTPAYKLDVAGTTQTDKLLISKPNSITNWNSLWQSGFYDANNAANAPESAGWFWGINMNHTSNTSTYRFGGQIAIRNSNTSPVMYFRSTNADGVGVWAKVLHSIGTQNIKGRMSIAPEGCAFDEGYAGNLVVTKPANSGQYINLIRQASFVWSIGTVYNNNTFAIGQGKTADSQFTNPFFTINTSGNVGIGTISPYYKLDVSGIIRAHEVRINTNTGADFVFEEDYVLRPLKEVSDFIRSNSHLPEIPPTADMVANGVDMGEFQIKLLQKIEELTLYVIEQDRQLKKQQEEINRLKRKL